jgi:hypothetical protein
MIEAMKQWLEALEDFVDVIKYDNEQDDIGRRACCDVLSYNPHREDCKAIKSIASLRQAIAELESQEPVAWISPSGALYRTRYHAVANAEQLLTPLFTHPPQRSESSGKPSAWVGLTDEEAQWLYDNCRTPSNLIDMVEAKLKERNS